MRSIIDIFQQKLYSSFSEFTLATSCAEAGLKLISQSRSDATVSLYLGEDLYTEPVTFSELIPVSNDFMSNTVALYQNMMVASWNDLLDEVFNYYLERHFHEGFEFKGLKKQSVKIDFSSGISIEEQVKVALQRDYTFKNYNDKFKLINEVLGTKEENVFESNVIRKHVLIRNAIQHHSGYAYSDMFKLLGSTTFDVMDRNGRNQVVKLGDKILITVPEFDLLKRCLQLITQNWRDNYA